METIINFKDLEVCRRYLWIQIFIANAKENRSSYVASNEADRAVEEFNKRFK